MFAHQVIEDLKKQIKKLENKESMKNISMKMEIAASDVIVSAQKFHFDNGDTIYGMGISDNLFMSQSTPIKTPFETMWLDFKMKNEKIGLALIHYTYHDLAPDHIDYDEYELFCFRYFNYPSSHWVMAPNIKFIKNGVFSNHYGDIVDLSKTTNDELGDDFIKYCARLAHNAILLLNCKNIQTEKIKAPEALNKKRRRNGKQEIFDYHVLNVVVPGKKRGYSPETEPLSHNRVHLCRGHFKEYTSEHPLFGHHTGLYWWQPHVRGQNKSGIVVKDYNVKTA